MTPENDTAQDHALEALIAASLRAPGKQPQVTDDDLKRFVDQQVTLSADDAAALDRAKPTLKREVLNILSNGQKKAFTKVEIPKSLLTLGEKKRLMLPQMQTLLNMRLQIVGHRCNSPTDDLELFDWERFYERVKEYIK